MKYSWRLWTYFMLISYHWWYCSCGLIYFIWNIQNEDLLSVYKNIALCVSGLSAGIFATDVFYNRRDYFTLLAAVNEHSQRVLKHYNSVKLQKESDVLFFGLSTFWVFGMVTGLFVIPLFVVEFIQTGDAYFKNIFYEFTPYSLGAWVTFLIQIITILWIIVGCTTLIFVTVELFLRISFFFRIIADDISNLRWGAIVNEGDELWKLKKLWEEYSFLQR